jgi:hypothetical protein
LLQHWVRKTVELLHSPQPLRYHVHIFEISVTRPEGNNPSIYGLILSQLDFL